MPDPPAMPSRPAARWPLPLFLTLAAACGGGAEPTAPPGPPPPPPPAAIPISGQAVPELAAMDQMVSGLLRDWRIPGAAVAVTYQERLVYARGFGYADTASRRVVQPDDLFRIASVSKPITAVAALRLADAGLLDLAAPAFALLPTLGPPPGQSPDPRLPAITGERLLWHAGGWDRAVSGDPVFQNAQIAAALGVTAPASASDVIRYMLGRSLDFDPGARYAYSNLGYMVLGRMIEAVTGESYETWVRREVLARAGITRMRIGRSRTADRAAGEVNYYDLQTAPSVFPGQGTVPFPDGGFYLESMDSHGGWIASAVDLAKFLTAVDAADGRPDLVPGPTLFRMLAPPPGNLWQGPVHYGMGWLVRPIPGNWWHNGSLPGTSSFVARYASGVTVAAVFNARQMTANGGFESQVDPGLGQALGAVTSWPSHNLFPQFP